MSARRARARETRRRRLMALFAASAGALAMLSVPIPLIELVVASTGLSEIVPAAAPPLGASARAMLAGFAALAGMGLSLTLSPRKFHVDEEEAGTPVEHLEEGRGTMGFALAKLTSFTRGRRTKGAQEAAEAMPVLRRADSHPDAPARRPIFASRDFEGAEIFAGPVPAPAADAYEAGAITQMADALDFAEEGVEPAAPERAETTPVAFSAFGDMSPPRAPEPLDDRVILTEAINALPPEDAPEAPVADVTVQAPPASLDGLSISELVDRFEHGIARRKALRESAAAVKQIGDVLAKTGRASPDASAEPRMLADIPPMPRVDVRAGVDAEVDEALRAALGTLQQITSR